MILSAEGLLFECFSHGANEIGSFNRLGNKVPGAFLHRFNGLFYRSIGGHHDDLEHWIAVEVHHHRLILAG